MSIKIAPNGNILLEEKEREKMKKDLEPHFKAILDLLNFDRTDQNLVDTPKRIAKSFVDELLVGCYTKEPKITVFKNTKNVNQMLVVGPIKVKSLCAHHFLSFTGDAYIGVIPDEILCGLSKLARIVSWFSRRPQIQEELTEMIVNYVQTKLKPKGCGVYITAQHNCMCLRGVEEENSNMLTCGLRGTFLEDASAKAEFLNHIELLMKRRK